MPEPDGRFIGAYAIWQREDEKWDLRWCMTGKCEEITQQHFQTENEAFNFAHDNFLQREQQVYRKVPGSDED